MAIHDKNGNVFKLRGPNPLMKDQKRDWDKTKLQLINMRNWKSEIVEDQRNPIEKFKTDFNVVEIGEELGLYEGPVKETEVVKAKDFIEDINEPVVPVAVVEKPPEKPVLNVDQRMARILRERGAEYYCAPAIGKKVYTDEFYGGSYSTIQYGDKFIFDAVIIDQSDFELQFWCIRNIEENSVVYRKERQGGERWWRVRHTESKTGGYLVVAVVSDSNPDFS